MANPYSAIKVFHHKDAIDRLRYESRIAAGDLEAHGGGGERPSAPIYIRLKPTNICNHHCVYCTYGSGDTKEKTENRDRITHTDMIPWDKLQEIISDMGEMGVKAITLSGGGEPLTYPKVVEAIRLIKRYGIELSLITNGQLLSEERAEEFYDAKWVRISFDSPNEADYMRLRGVSSSAFRQVIKNIGDFAKHKDKDCVLGINFVVGKANYLRVYEAAALLKSLGVSNVKFAAVVENTAHYHDDIKDTVIEQIHRAQSELEDESFAIFNNYENDWQDKHLTTQPFSTCYVCKLVTVIAADQKVYLCHTRAYDSSAVVGDLRDKTFKELWFSEEARRFLSSVNPKTDCKNFCAYQTRNELIQAFFDTTHVNFI